MADVTIVRASEADALEVARIFRESRLQVMPYLPVLHSADDDLVFFRSDVFPRATVWVAIANAAIFGFIAVHEGWVEHLYVRPGWERKGIGRALLRTAMAHSNALQLWVFQRNTAALAFYEHFGFRAVRHTDGSANDEREPDVLLSWQRDLAIERVTAPTDEVRALIGELDRELGANYPPEQQHGLTVDDIFTPSVRFFIARLDGAAVGCGGIATFADFAELKRMYVRPAVRRSGVADALVARLIDEAAAAGLQTVRLETGVSQHAALRFYARHGFGRCAAFEPYASMEPHTIAASVFMERKA
jgi:GNAT superfamily N-acetyltransferase